MIVYQSKIMRIIPFLISLLFLACNSSVKEISVMELKERMDKNQNIQLLDVRTPNEQEEGVIGNPIRINIFDDNFETLADNKLDKKKEVYIYCRSGGRSMKAAELLAKKGYKVINIDGGYRYWKAKIQSVK